jgi:hypothetical protein
MTGSMEASVRFLIALSSVVLILLASPPAGAQQDQGSRGLGRGAPGRPTPPQQVPARDAANRDARMTPEQRRQLRRDVHDHGRDIYRERTAGRNRP